MSCVLEKYHNNPVVRKIVPHGITALILGLYLSNGFFLVWTYYDSNYLKVLVLGKYFTMIFAGILIGMTFWSQYKSIKSNPGVLRLSSDSEEAKELINMNQYSCCPYCSIPMAYNSYHCWRCNVCVMNLDHHCIWTNNCVGLLNRKFFVLLLIWGSIALFYGALVGGVCLPNILQNYQVVYFIDNKYRTVKREVHRSMYENFLVVFGDDPLYWFIPVGMPKQELIDFYMVPMKLND